MSDWVLIACLKRLFAEFDIIAPNRGHASDGSIGDTAHQHEVSDHNDDEVGKVPIHDADHIHEVHAIDVDVDLREPGLSMEDVVQFLLGRCRSGAEKRLRYIIYNRRIWEASNGWKQRAYTGASAHTEHAHFSASYDTDKEASTASWHLEDIPVALTSADKAWVEGLFKAYKDDYAVQVLTGTRLAGTETGPAGSYQRNLADLTSDVWSLLMRGVTRGGDPAPEAGVLGQMRAELDDLKAQLAALKTAK